METQTKFSRECKELMSRELKELFKEHPNFIISNYFGLSSNDLNDLRKKLGGKSSKYFVVKNRIAKKVLESLKLKDTSSFIKDGVGIGFIGGDVVEAAKSIVDFSKEHQPFEVKGACIEGQVLNPEKVRELASLPSREVLIAMILNAMQSPITGFVNTLAGVMRKFVYAVKAIKEQKESKGESE